ncbi:MAG: DMT family transporter [Mangrovicoccus sp.]
MSSANAQAGLAIMICVTIGGAMDSVIVRLLAGEVHPIMIGFSRALFGLLALAPLLIRRPEILHTNARWSHLLRAGLKLASLITLFAAWQMAPLATVTAIGFASPLFVALGAWLILSEPLGGSRVIGLVLGFAGILVILGPSLGLAQSQALGLALLSALLTGIIQLMLKVMGRGEGALTLVAWNLIASLPLALIPALFVWTWPSAAQWGLLALQGLIGTGCQLGVTRALQLADASLIAPVDFLRLPMVALTAWLIFAEIPPLATFFGGVMIFGAVTVLSLGAARKNTMIRMRG